MKVNNENAEKQLALIKPGVNYPRTVRITEKLDKKIATITFSLCSYFVGMYCAMQVPDRSLPVQLGDHDNKTFVRKLVGDIRAAIGRGAQVEIDNVEPVTTA